MTIRENDLHVTNTLTRRREKFEPLSPPHVGMYVCGPTVYGDAHLGHAKSYISFDIIVRYLRYLGYDVTYVQNVTDVGHLTDDADAGEDKVEKAARAKKVHPMQIAEHFTRRYFEDMDRLNVLRPDISPRASGHIVEQIEHTKRLIEGGHAYEANGSVYFDVASWPAYGRLSGRSVKEMQAGARVEVSAEKRHPADFALWKRAEPGHIMQWPSPWGPGYPGWHIECTVMGQKYLGETLDIHGGGIENQFPHHEDEIAQAEAATGKPFVRYWLHNNMVTVGGQKMGKSLGNFLTLRDAFKKWDPMVIRLFILQSHYRSPTDFSEDALDAVDKGFSKIRAFASSADIHLDLNRTIAAMGKGTDGGSRPPARSGITSTLDKCYSRFREAMDSDFNSPQALAQVFKIADLGWDLMAEGDLEDKQKMADVFAARRALRELAEDVLGLNISVTQEAVQLDVLPKVIDIIIEQRAEARKAKDFKGADAIRNCLAEAGIWLEDTPDGTTWRIK